MRAVHKAYDGPQKPRAEIKPGDLSFFFQFFKPVWKLGFVSITLMFFLSAARSVVPLSGKVIIDYVILKSGYEGISGALSAIGLGAYSAGVISLVSSIDVVVFGMIVLGIIFGALQMAQSYITMRYQQELTFNVQKRLFDQVLRYPISFFKDRQTGYLMSRISGDVSVLQYLFSGLITQTLSNVFYMIFCLAILLSLNAKLVIVVLGMIPVYFLVNRSVSGRMRALSHQEMESNAELSKDMQEVLSGVEVVKAYTSEDKEVEKISGKMRKVIRARTGSTILSTFSGAISRGVQSLMMLGIMWAGANEVRNGAMTIGDYTAFVAYIAMMAGSIGSLFYTHLSLQSTMVSMGRLKEMFNVKPEHEPGRPLMKPAAMYGSITFDRVSFSYAANEPLLEDMSFEAQAGDVVALVGPSGVGKTTLVNLILKFYLPLSGKICLDGNDLNDIDPVWLRKQIGIVSQDIFLFNDTIGNNIRYGNPAATQSAVIEAAKKARIHDDIERLPDGYDTVVGERGAKLSAGQRQRVSIARAYLKGMRILILDEPTSSLDPGTERHLKESLRELVKGKTTFIISHRMSFLDIANKIVMIDKGRIVYTGDNNKPIIYYN